jgi:hypothetical protein
MSLIADGLGGATSGKTSGTPGKADGFDAAADKAAKSSSTTSADAAERQAEKKAAPKTASPYAKDPDYPKPAAPAKPASTPVSADAAERRAETKKAGDLPSGLPAYMYPGWTPLQTDPAPAPKSASSHSAPAYAKDPDYPRADPSPAPAASPASTSPVSADAAERQAQAAAGEVCTFVPAEPKTVVVKPGDTIWGYWKDDHAGHEWQPYKNDFKQQNSEILSDGWLHPGEVAQLPVKPGDGTTVCTPLPQPEPAPQPEPVPAPTAGELPSGLPPYMYPGWTPPVTPQALPPGLPPYMYPGWTPPTTSPTTAPTATPAAAPASAPYSPATNEISDWATWAKQGLFAVRAGARFFGLDAAKDVAKATGVPLSGGWAGLDKFSKVVGLGGFAIAQTVLKANDAIHYFQEGETERAWASIADGANGLRIGMTSIAPLLPAGAEAFIGKYMSGTPGNAFGVFTNVAAGTLKGIDIWQDADAAMAQATTQRERDQIQYNKWEAEVGNGLDTVNDAAPFLMDAGSTWLPWLGGKVMDHVATATLEDTNYVPVSIGAEKARNLMPLAAAVGLVPTVEHYDVSTAQTNDERIVLDEMNSIEKAGDIGTGVAEIGITGTEVGLVGYATGGNPQAIYATMQVDHMVRQGLNVWTGYSWQNADERAAAVEAAGLDPRLDPHRVEYEQPDFLSRSMTSMMSDADIARLRGKVAAGGASDDEIRFLEIVDQYDRADISDATNGRGSNDAWYSPSSVWQGMKLTNPVYSALEDAPEQIGFVTGWVQGGGVGKTYDKVSNAVTGFAGDVSDFAGNTWDSTTDYASDAWDAGGEFVSEALLQKS